MPYLISCVMATSVLKLCSVSGGASSSAPEEELPGEGGHQSVPAQLKTFSHDLLRHRDVLKHLQQFLGDLPRKNPPPLQRKKLNVPECSCNKFH